MSRMQHGIQNNCSSNVIFLTAELGEKNIQTSFKKLETVRKKIFFQSSFWFFVIGNVSFFYKIRWTCLQLISHCRNLQRCFRIWRELLLFRQQCRLKHRSGLHWACRRLSWDISEWIEKIINGSPRFSDCEHWRQDRRHENIYSIE